jgi:hypothetical protein
MVYGYGKTETVARGTGTDYLDELIDKPALGRGPFAVRYGDDRMDDRKLASQVSGIDLIIGGHTHTFLERPETIQTPGGGLTLVTQAGHSGIRLGRIDLPRPGSTDPTTDSAAATNPPSRQPWSRPNRRLSMPTSRISGDTRDGSAWT